MLGAGTSKRFMSAEGVSHLLPPGRYTDHEGEIIEAFTIGQQKTGKATFVGVRERRIREFRCAL